VGAAWEIGVAGAVAERMPDRGFLAQASVVWGSGSADK